MRRLPDGKRRPPQLRDQALNGLSFLAIDVIFERTDHQTAAAADQCHHREHIPERGGLRPDDQRLQHPYR